MSKYIKLEDMENLIINIAPDGDVFERGISALKNTPTIEIVRCKDCMENTINTDGATEPWCYKFGYAVEDTDFCSYGERIESEDE